MSDGVVLETIDDKTTPSGSETAPDAHKRPTKVGVDVTLIDDERKIAASGKYVVMVSSRAAFWFVMVGVFLAYFMFAVLVFQFFGIK